MRPHLLLRPKAPIVCPQELAGTRHLLKTNALVMPLGLLRCTHRPSAQQGECGARILALALVGGWHYVAVVDPREIKLVEQMEADDVMAYLLSGASLPAGAAS